MKINKVLCGEYFASYITDSGRVLYNTLNGIADAGIQNIKDGYGGQYANIVLDTAGKAYIVGYRQTNGNFVNTIPGTGWEQVYACWQSYFLVKSGKLYAYGKDKLKVNGGADITIPKLLTSSAKFTKFVVSSAMQDGYMYISGLATDSTVWQWATDSGLTARQVIFPGNKARNIAYVGPNAMVVETDNDLYGWSLGTKGEYIGIGWNQTTPVSIKSQYTDKGCVFPLKELVGNWNTLHVIDANDEMYGQGDQAQGEVGAGAATDYSSNRTYTWNWMLTKYQPVTKITTGSTKWKNLCAGNTVAFYMYAQDLNDNWFSWGRNKAMVLGNGYTLNSDNEAAYPNYLDMASPSFVDPLNQKKWTVIPFDSLNQPPRIPVPAPSQPGDNSILIDGLKEQINVLNQKVADLSNTNSTLTDTISKQSNIISGLEGKIEKVREIIT